ncbi:MAG: cardiolipin synthase [Elusimicrobiota bacterium]
MNLSLIHLERIHIVFLVSGILLSLFISMHAIVRKRDSKSALLWVGVAWVLPYLGALFYYLFGINRIERKASKIRKNISAVAPSIEKSVVSSSQVISLLSPTLGHLNAVSRLVEKVDKKPLLEGNKITPLINGDEAYPEMVQAIDSAEHSIGLSTFIFNNDRAGELIIQALARAAKRKVEIRALIDDVGSGYQWSKVYKRLTEKNINVAYFMPTLAPWRMAYLNLRNHRKILTIDGKVGFTGGMNIHEENLIGLKTKKPTFDLHFKCEGPVVFSLQEAFIEDWFFSTKEVLQGEKWFPPLWRAGITLARGIADGPDENFEICRWAILGALANAQKSVKIVTPYFVPDQSLITALNMAAMSGVEVDIIIPESNDMVMIRWASQALLWQLLEKGCRVWFSKPPFDHTKLMVVDGAWSLFGSTNWDQRSLRLNFEFNVECYDITLARKLEEMINLKIKASRSVTLEEVDSRPLWMRLRDGSARLFSPLL